MKTEIKNAITRRFHRVLLAGKEHSPEILVIGGIVLGIGATVAACKASTKAGAILDDMHEKMDQVHEVAEMGREDYTEQDLKKDTVVVYAQTGVKFIKLYGPAIILGAAAITSILAGQGIMKKRNAAITAAYVAVDKSFNEYRGRVKERFGEELDRELRYNVKAEEIENIVVNEETGEETIEKETIYTATPKYSDFARCFTEGSLGWCKDASKNLMILRKQQEYLTKKLEAQGHLFLNEVYDVFGFDRIPAGQIIGWVYDPKRTDIANDVNFNLYDITDESKRLFVNGKERSVWLDFNVDGPVYDIMKGKKKKNK